MLVLLIQFMALLVQGSVVVLDDINFEDEVQANERRPKHEWFLLIHGDDDLSQKLLQEWNDLDVQISNKTLRFGTVDWTKQTETARRLRIRRVPQTLYIKSRKQYNITDITSAEQAAQVLRTESLKKYTSRKIPEKPSWFSSVAKSLSESVVESYKYSPVLFIVCIITFWFAIVWLIHICTDQDVEEQEKKDN